MSIHKLKVGPRRVKWIVRWKEEGRHRGRRFDSFEEAKDFEDVVMAEVRRRRQLGAFAPPEASKTVLGDHVRKCWEQRGVGWEDSTKRTWGGLLDAWIIPLLDQVPLRELNKQRVRAFRAQMVTEGVRLDGGGQRVATNNTANSVMTVLSAFLGYAVEDELIPENPCRDIRPLSHKPSKHKAHPPIVLERMRVLMSPRDALVVSLMYLAGLRPEEVFALQWQHVGETTLFIEQATTAGKVKVTKTGAGAPVDLVAPLAEELAAYRAAVKPGPEDLVIEGRQGDGILRLRPWRDHVWHVARRAAGVGKAVPYDGRHTFGSLLIHEGRDILEVQRQMRHASARTTLAHYAHEFAEWKGREKVPLVQLVREARHRAIAELRADPEDPAAAAELIPDRPDGPPPGAGAQSSNGGSGVHSVARILHAPAGEAADDAVGTRIVTGMGVTGLEPVTPSLSSWCSPN